MDLSGAGLEKVSPLSVVLCYGCSRKPVLLRSKCFSGETGGRGPAALVSWEEFPYYVVHPHHGLSLASSVLWGRSGPVFVVS